MDYEIISQLAVHLTSQYVIYKSDIQLNTNFKQVLNNTIKYGLSGIIFAKCCQS
jgi:hypothetical protein